MTQAALKLQHFVTFCGRRLVFIDGKIVAARVAATIAANRKRVVIATVAATVALFSAFKMMMKNGLFGIATRGWINTVNEQKLK